MVITLVLKPETEARLITQAAARGMSMEDFLKATIDTLLATSDVSSLPILSAQERAEKFVRWAKSHSIETEPLSDEAISRESIYQNREDRQR